ncbi:MAG TPA: hypothetical protein VN578_16865 [Candidatus Binatia bacterium]|jgi:hypothetical protein|nr:hypothetical protein [Candidatus Binatia bacterium]
MKHTLASVACGLVSLALVQNAHGQPKAIFFTSNVLPPPNSTYISPAQWHALYANGVIISNVTHRAFTETQPPPPLGTSSTHTFNSELDFDLSLNNGTTFTRVTAPSQVTVNLQAVGTGPGGQQIYNTEMLQLNISGGTLPPGVQVRASTSQPSIGQTTITPASGGFMISSFFDIFTELSLDGGNTWSPSRQAGHMDMRADPTLVPPVPEPSALVPPPTGVFLPPTQSQVGFAGGVVIKNVRTDLFSQSLDLAAVPIGTPKLGEQFGSTANFLISIDGGATFTAVNAPATVSLTLQDVNPGPPTIWDTQMTQLDIIVTGLQKPIMIRQSPTLPSYGETAVQQTSDGSFRIDSFFDIFTELSLDGGNTWQPPTNGPAHVELQRAAILNKFNVPNMPPTNGQYSAPGPIHYTIGTSGVVLSNLALQNMLPSQPLPPPGQSQLQTFEATANLMVSLDNGRTFMSNSAPASGLVTVSNTSPGGSLGPAYYNTELLQLNISGGNLPPGLMVRESPSKVSLGRTSSIQDTGPTGGYRISSFFDVFTELSLNNGQTWNPVDSPSSVALFPWPSYAPYGVTCPSDITVYATSPSGAIVNYTIPPITIFPDCPLCCFSAAGVPPSGSLFPIGTSTVHVTGSDGCGEHPTCSFIVTVLQPFIYDGLADSAIARCILVNSNIFTTNQYLVLSNLFSDSSDGAHFNLGAAQSVFLNFLPFPATANCPTDYFTTAFAPYAQDPNHPMGSGTYLGGINPMIGADFSSLGADHVILEVHDPDDDHLVYSNRFVNNALIPINILFPPPCTNYGKTSYTYGQTADHICYRFCIFGCNCLGTNCYIERVACFRPDIAVLPVNADLSGLDLRGAAAKPPGSFAIQSTEVGNFGMRHQALGQATFDSRSGVLFLDNIGANGQDGVTVNLGMAGLYDMTLAPTMLSNAGTCWEMFAYGKFNGMENAPVGIVGLSQLGPGNGLLVQDDFSPINSSNTVVYVYDAAGRLVNTFNEPNGLLGRLMNQGNLTGCGLRIKPMPGFDLRFDSPFVFTPQVGTGVATGTELQVSAAGPGSLVPWFTEFGVSGCGINQIAITGESAQPVLAGILKRTDGSFEIDGQGMAGAIYQLQMTSRLGSSGTQWSPVSTATAGPDGSFQLFDTSPATLQKFYQVSRQGFFYH